MRIWNCVLNICNLIIQIYAPIKYKKKKILGIWDFKSLPWSVGDPMVFMEYLSVLKIKYNAESVDVCIVYDKSKPLGKRTSINGDAINSENSQDFILEYLPLFNTSPFMGSLFQFNSRDEYYKFLKKYAGSYHLVPSLWAHLTGQYNFYDNGASTFKVITRFYDKYKYIPFLSVPFKDLEWAKLFYFNKLPINTVPVTLSLRQTSSDLARNANLKIWLKFIDKCALEVPEVLFCIVGLAEETFPEYRERANVIITKDYGTDLSKDIALIRKSAMYMCTLTGINIIALFSDLPYLFFQSPSKHIYGLKENENYNFATKKQYLFSTSTLVTSELLFSEFIKIYTNLNFNINTLIDT